MASMYAVYHGPEGLTAIAEQVHSRALEVAGMGEPVHAEFFDTVQLRVSGRARDVVRAAAEHGINVWAVGDEVVSIACDETTTAARTSRP